MDIGASSRSKKYSMERVSLRIVWILWSLAEVTMAQGPGSLANSNTVCSFDKCFVVEPELQTWDDAQRHCQSKGQSLATLDTPPEQRLIAGKLKSPSWIGLQIGVSHPMAWQSGLPYNTKFGQTIQTANTLSCGILLYDEGTGTHNEFLLYCGMGLGYICEYPLASTDCLALQYTYDASLQKCFSVSQNEFISWVKAAKKCRSRHGGSLITVRSQVDRARLERHIDQRAYWTGVSRMLPVWVDRTSRHVPPFSLAWEEGSPIDNPMRQCFLMDQPSGKVLHARSCASRYAFVCSYGAELYTTTSTTTTADPSTIFTKSTSNSSFPTGEGQERPPEEPSQNRRGLGIYIAGASVVVIVLVVIVALIIVFYRKRKEKSSTEKGTKEFMQALSCNEDLLLFNSPIRYTAVEGSRPYDNPSFEDVTMKRPGKKEQEMEELEESVQVEDKLGDDDDECDECDDELPPLPPRVISTPPPDAPPVHMRENGTTPMRENSLYKKAAGTTRF